MTRRAWIIIVSLALVFSVVIGALQWEKYSRFDYNGLDLGIYSQTVWSLAHGHGFASSIHDPSYLGDHLEPWLVPMSWLYRLWPSPVLLLWLQTLIIASAVVPLAKIAHRYLGHRGAYIAASLFVVNPLVYNVALYEFHGLVVLLPLVLWSIWFYVEHRWAAWIITIAAITITREDAPLLVAGWTILGLIDRRNWRWWLPPLIAAIAWFPAAQAIIRHANHDGVYKYIAFYRWLGDSPLAMATFPFRHPLLFLAHTITMNNVGTVLGLSIGVGFVCWLRPRYLWPLVLPAAQLLLNNAEPGTYLRIHYTIPFIPFMAWAAIAGVQDFYAGRLWPSLDRRFWSLVIALFAIVGPVYANMVVGPTEWPWFGVHRETTSDPRVLQAAVRTIRPADRVLSSFAFLPNLADRTSLYSLNYVYLGRRQYSDLPYLVPTNIDVAIIDWQQLYEYQYLYRDTLFQGQSGPERIQKVLDDNHLRLAERYGTVAVYRPDGNLTGFTAPAPTATAVTARIGTLKLLGQPATSIQALPSLPGWRELHINSAWRSIAPQVDNYVSVRYTLQTGTAAVFGQSQILGEDLVPSSEWPAGTIWKTTSIVALPPTLHGTYTLKAEYFVPGGRYRLDRLRSFRPIIDRVQRLGTETLGQVSL